MKLWKSAISWFVIVLFVFSIGTSALAAMTQTEKEEKYAAALSGLESYLENPGDAMYRIDNVIADFESLQNYSFSKAFVYYAKVLKSIEAGDYGWRNDEYLFSLQQNDKFNEYVKSLTASPIYEAQVLLAYYEGRKAEVNGDTNTAMVKYGECKGFYDVNDRRMNLVGSKYKGIYDEGAALMEQGKLVDAYLCFEQCSEYEDTSEIMTFIVSQLGYTPGKCGDNHAWNGWQETKTSTCSTEGTEERTCIVCGMAESRNTALKGHTWGSWQTTVTATCTEEGTEQRTCSICSKTESQSTAKAEHDWAAATVQAPQTCRACGTTTGKPLAAHHTTTILKQWNNNEWSSLELPQYTNSLIGKKSGDTSYAVYSLNGTRVSGYYEDIDDHPVLHHGTRFGYYDVWAVDRKSMNNQGLLDASGNLIIPCKYQYIDVVSERWIFAWIASSGTESNQDKLLSRYDNYCKGKQVDVYYRGSLVGMLGMNDIESPFFGNRTAYGDYLLVNGKNGYKCYDRSMKKITGYGGSYYVTPSEYVVDKNSKQIYHFMSGQRAFYSGCTLKENEVEQKYYVIDKCVYDLQGNLVGDFSSYNSINLINAVTGPWNQYVKVGKKDCDAFALADVTGHFITDFTYRSYIFNDIDRDYALAYNRSSDGVYTYTFISLKDGSKMKVYGTEEMEAEYYHPFAVDKKTGRIQSATTNVWTGQYTGFGYHSAKAIILEKSGIAGVKSIYDEDIIPFDGTYRTYSFDLSADGSLILAHSSKTYTLIQVNYK